MDPKTVEIIAGAVAALLAVIELVRSKGQGLIPWAVLVIAAWMLWSVLR